MDPGKLEIFRFWDIMTSEFLLKIPFEKFERFEVSLSSFRDRENPYEKERELEHTEYLEFLIFNGLVVILYALYILILMCICIVGV